MYLEGEELKGGNFSLRCKKMKVTYYVKIVRSMKSEGVDLSFPNLPNLGSILCKDVDEAVMTARSILKEIGQRESFLPLPMVYVGEEFYSVIVDV